MLLQYDGRRVVSTKRLVENRACPKNHLLAHGKPKWRRSRPRDCQDCRRTPKLRGDSDAAGQDAQVRAGRRSASIQLDGLAQDGLCRGQPVTLLDQAGEGLPALGLAVGQE